MAGYLTDRQKKFMEELKKNDKKTYKMATKDNGVALVNKYREEDKMYDDRQKYEKQQEKLAAQTSTTSTFKPKKVDVASRDGYPYANDPSSYGKERQIKKLQDPSYNMNEKKTTYDKMVNKKNLTKSDLAQIQQNKQVYNANKKESLTENLDPSYRNYLISEMRKREDRGEKLTYKEKLFADGKLVSLPDPNDKTPIVEPLVTKQQAAKNEAKKQKENQKKYTKEFVENQQLINKQNGTNKYSATTDTKVLSKALKNTADLSKSDLDHLSKKDIAKLKSAKENGDRKALVQYNGELRNLDIDKVLKYDDSFSYRRGFNWKDKVMKNDSILKGLSDYAGDGAKYAGKRVLDALDTVGQFTKGYEESMRKSTGIEMGKVLKPLQGESSSDEKKLSSAKAKLASLTAAKKQNELLAKQQGKNAIDTTKMGAQIEKVQKQVNALEAQKKSGNWTKSDKGVQTAKKELKDILSSSKSLGGLNPANQVKALKEGLSGSVKSLSGYYTKHPEEAKTAYKALVDQGWDKDDLSTKIYGFAGDVAAGISPTGAGKQVITKGGKIVANESKIAKLLTTQKGAARKQADTLNIIDKNLTKGVKNSELGTKAKNQVMELFKKNGSVTESQIDDIVKGLGQDALTSSKAGKLSKSQQSELKKTLLESRIAKFEGKDIPEQQMSNRYKTAIEKNLSNISKREANGQNATKRQIEALGMNTIRGNQSRINNIVKEQSKQNKLDDKTYKALLNRYNQVDSSIPALKESEKAADQSFLDQFAFDNKTWKDNLKDAAMGPIKGNTKLTMFGKAIPGSDKLVGAAMKYPNAIAEAIGNTTPVQKFNGHFNKMFRVDDTVKNKVYEMLGNSNYEKGQVATQLQDLLKGSSKKDLQELGYYMARPGEQVPNKTQFGSMRGVTTQLPEKFAKQVEMNGETKSVAEHLRDLIDQSHIQDNAVRKQNGMNEINYLENYLPAVYKNSEAELDKIFGKTTTRPSTSVTPSSHEEKVYKDFIHGMDQDDRLKAVTDAGKLAYKRMADGVDFRNRQGLKKWYEDMQGINPDMFNRQTNRFIQEAINPESFKRAPRGVIGSAVKGMNDIWKGYTMNTLSGTALRNLYGGAVNNTLDGVGLKDYLRAAQMQFGKDTSKLKLADGSNIEKAQFAEKAAKNGIDQGQFTADVHAGDLFDGNSFGKKSLWDQINPLNPTGNIYTAPARKINTGVEQFLRNARFIKGLDDYGVSGAKQAGADVRRAQFDYNPQTSLTNTEQNIRDYLVPFYTFQRHNLPFQAAKTIQNPGMMNAFANMPRAFNQNDPNEDVKPEYMDNYLYLGQNEDGTSKYLPTSWNSVNDFKDWFDPEKKVENAVAPMYKALHDGFADTGMGSGFSLKGTSDSQLPSGISQELVSEKPAIAKILGLQNVGGEIKQDRNNQQVINDLLPQANNIRNFTKAFSEGGNGFSDPKVLQAILGASPQTFDAEKQRGYNKTAAQFDAMNQIDELKKLPSSDPRKLYENYNYDPYAEENAKNPRQDIPYYDMFRAYTDDINQHEQYKKVINDYGTQYTAAAKYYDGSKDKYGNKMTYDIFGNPIAVQFKYATPKTDAQREYYDYLNQQVEEGKVKSEQAWKSYNDIEEKLKNGQFTLESLYEMEGYKNPWKKIVLGGK